MIRILPMIPSNIGFRSVGHPKTLPFNLTISLSYRCNSRCKTCNIWRKTEGISDDLSLEEYEKIFKKLGRSVFWATLSGGEPFMRRDIAEIAKSLYTSCHPKIINIPTNGLLGAYIAKKAEEIALACPGSEIVVNLSLDGVGKKHDDIRGIPGNFDRAMEAYGALRKISLKNFSLGVHSVISKLNHKDMPELCDFVLDMLGPDSYISEVAEERIELDTIGAGITPSHAEYSEAVGYIAKRMERYCPKKGISRITRAFRMGYYDFAKEAIACRDRGSIKQPIPCYAGFASGQISPKGDVWGCCIRAEPLGNLRENDYDLKGIWFGGRAEAFRKSVKRMECSCPLANAYYSSAVHDPMSMGKAVTKLL